MLITIRIFVKFNSALLWYLIYNLINNSNCETKNYCSAEFCNNTKRHIMCKFQSPGPTHDCVNYEKLLNTQKQKHDVLDRINSRRNKVASGVIHSLLSAENMLKLEWNKELELLAQRLADQCFGNNTSDVTDFCQDLENTSVGQNIGTIYGDSPGLTAPSLVDLWYMELLNLNSSSLRRYTQHVRRAWHWLVFSSSSMLSLQHYDYFTQLVWAESSHVGCGGVKFKEINTESNEKKYKTVYRLICNFAPSGNIIGQAVYSDGVPCSRCPGESYCDSQYQYLCSKKQMASISLTTLTEQNDDFQLTREYKYDDFSHVNLNHFLKVNNRAQKYEVTPCTKLSVEQNPITHNINIDNDTSFDLLSHLFDTTLTISTNLKQSTLPCKDVLGIDEFIELLKNKLRTDQTLKDLFTSATKTSPTDPSFTDRTVVAIVNQLYSKKETTTMSKTTHEENINSTLLANLVEAVIFRQSDRFSTTEDSNLRTQIAPIVSPVKIQAELGEIKSNSDFTGHYFFPEEEEQTVQETTEFYDDFGSLPISEISLEIEDLKRNRETKDFLEDILESDFMTESITRDQPILNNNNNNNNNATFVTNVKGFGEIDLRKDAHSNNQQIKRIKRKYRNYLSELNRHGIFINYSELLRKLAKDIRNLKLNEKFHCSSTMINRTAKIFYNHCYFVIFIHIFIFYSK